MSSAKSDYTIDSEKKLIINKISGHVKFEDFSEIFSKIVADPDFTIGMSSIINISEADVDYDMTKLLLFYDEIEQKSSIRGKCKWAIVVSEEIHHGYHEMFKTLCEDGNYDISFFTSEEAAESWILS